MICNAAGIALIKQWEGCRVQAYSDVGGVSTIGYGHTGPEVHLGLMWTQAQCDLAFMHDLLHRAEIPLGTMLGGVDLTANQFSALCALTFNIGAAALRASQTLHDILDGNLDDLPRQWRGFDHVHGQVVPGLLNRRNAELALWDAA